MQRRTREPTPPRPAAAPPRPDRPPAIRGDDERIEREDVVEDVVVVYGTTIPDDRVRCSEII